MYELYARKDYQKVQSLYAGLEHMLHRVVAMLVLMGVVAITLIYPLILADNNLGAVEIRAIPHRKSARYRQVRYDKTMDKQMTISAFSDELAQVRTKKIIVGGAHHERFVFT